MNKSENQIDYVGNELDIFKHASNWKSYFSKKIGSHITGDVLEVGAGIGINAEYMANASKSYSSWTILEPDNNLAEQIDSNTKALKNKEIIHGIITDVDDNKYDTIIYIDVLEHIEKSKQEIVLIKQKLKENGRLIILVPAYQFLYNDFDKSIGHFRRYHKNLLLNEINNEFVKERLFYLDSVSFFASLANKLILKKTTPSEGNIHFWDKILVRISKITDVLSFYTFGKSLIGVFKK